MIVVLSSWSSLSQNEVSRFLKRIDMAKDDITLQLGDRWAQELKKYFGKMKLTASQFHSIFKTF